MYSVLFQVLVFQYEQANTNNWTLSNNAVRRNSRDLRNVGNIEQLYSLVEEKINHIFDQVDVNNDGFISHGEFLCAMTGLDYYLDAEPFHKEHDEDDSGMEGSDSEEEEPTPPPMATVKAQLTAQSSNKYRDVDLQDLTNNEFAYVNDEVDEDNMDPVELALKKASQNAKNAQSPVKKNSLANINIGPTGSNKSREGSPVRIVTTNNVPCKPSYYVLLCRFFLIFCLCDVVVPISTTAASSGAAGAATASKDKQPSPTGLNIRVTSLDRNSNKSTSPSTAASFKATGGSDSDIKYGASNTSFQNASSSAAAPIGSGKAKMSGVDLQHAATQKSGTPEASPRRGNLAFYEVEQNIKG